MKTARLRFLAAALLAFSLALPSYTCDGYQAPSGEKVESIPDGADAGEYTAVQIPHYVLEKPDLDDFDFWIAIFAFTWPLPWLALRARYPDARITRWLRWSEPPLAVGSAWFIYMVGNIGRPAVGTYVALTANAALVAIWIRELVASRSARSVSSAPGRGTGE